MVWGGVLHREQRGEVWCVSSTLCGYDIMMRLLLVRSYGASLCMSLLWLRCRRSICTMLVCICVEFAEI